MYDDGYHTISCYAHSYFVLIMCDGSNRSGHSAQGLLPRNGRLLTVLGAAGDLSPALLFISHGRMFDCGSESSIHGQTQRDLQEVGHTSLMFSQLLKLI
jgi:hypothetical protein